MSAGEAFGDNRGARPVPPEKGVIPLDHKHLCDLERKELLGCLDVYGSKNDMCRHLSRKYYRCRMIKKQMEKQDMENSGRSLELEAHPEENVKGTIER